MKYRSSSRTPYADGYPATDSVAARRLRSRGDLVRRSGPVVLSNGTNAFTVDLAPYRKVSVEFAEGGVHNIVGRDNLDAGTPGVVLANFGSEKAAKNGYAALMRAHSGVRVTGGGSFGVVKWCASLFGLFCVVVLFSAVTTPMQPSAAAADASEMFAPQSGSSMPQRQSGFDPGEPSLEDLASGKYQFQPKLKAPDIVAPTLNCAPTR